MSVFKPKTEAVKSGRTSWQPASVTEVTNKEEGYRYRWVIKDPHNLAKKEQEGWEKVDGLQANKVSIKDEGARVSDPTRMTSLYEKHDVILQRIPEELAEQRDAYYNNETARRTQGLTAHIKKEMGKEGAETHGDITISTRSA